MTSSYVVPSMTDGPHFEILERNWRRVASTHTLQVEIYPLYYLPITIICPAPPPLLLLKPSPLPHFFQDLLNADKPAKDQPSSKWKYFLIG
jgi:hypothetical protein